MPNDRIPLAPPDAERIDVTEELELRYWVTTLGVSEAAVRQAVAQVGFMAMDVRSHLGLPEARR